MANSYPRRDQASGIWKINQITKNIKDQGTYPQTSSQNTAIYSGGATPSSVVTMDTFQINTAGNAVDFGDLAVAIRPTANAGDFVTIASDGNASNFGDLSQARSYPMNGTSSSPTRAVAAGGDASGITNVIDYRAIASAGNFSDFGDLTVPGS